MSILSDAEIELKLRDFFESNFQYLKESSGHVIDGYMKEKAFQQVLYYWRKNRKLIEKITRSEVKLSLPERFTPNGKIPYTIEGIVDIVQEKDGTWLYDLKTHDIERIKANIVQYKEQLYIYSYIWKKLQGNTLDNTAVISTSIPNRLENAIKKRRPDLIEKEVEAWEPIIPIGYNEDEVEEMINNFGEVVEKIEKSEFQPPDIDVLINKPAGMKNTFAFHVCRNCDVRFSCSSYKKYLEVSKGAKKKDLQKYMKPSQEESSEFIEGNLE